MKIRLSKKRNSTKSNIENKNESFGIREEKILDCPPSLFKASKFMSINAILQAVADMLLEIAIFAGIFLKIPLRLEFLFLAAISALLASHTLNGIRRNELDVTQDSAQVSLLVEICLLVADIIFLINFAASIPIVILVRAPFMILTFANILIVTYIIFRLELFEFTIFKKIKSIFIENFAKEE